MLEQQSFFLESRGVRLAASLIVPSDGVRGLLLVAQPLVEERKAALPAIMEASRQLAERLDFAVLRFDYPGTGDSEGNFADFGPDNWIAALDDAAAWLRERFEGLPLVCLGIRTGATLLTSSQSDFLRNAQKVLWDPVSGEEAVKQWLQRHMVNDMVAYGKARVSRSALEATLAGGGSADLDGFELTGAQYAGLAKLGLGDVSEQTFVVVSGRPSAATTKWVEANAGNGELLQLRTPPYWNSVGYVDTKELRDATVAWFAREEETGNNCSEIAIEHKCSQIENNNKTLCVSAPSAALRETSSSAHNRPTLQPSNCQTVKPSNRQTCDERFVSFESDRGVVHGVLTLPEGEIRRTVLFLGGWSGDRQGPHRLFLLYARHLAGQGTASLRIDYRGRGESDGEHDEAGIATMADDAERAAGWLRSEGFLPCGLDVIAICSGCKVAITLATRVDVRHLDLLSAESMGSLRAKGTNAAKTASALRSYIRKLFRRETWRKIFRGEVRTDMVGKALAHHETRSADEARAEDGILSRFRSYRGTIAFVYGGSDPDAPGARAGYERFCRKHSIAATFDTIPNAGHSYYALDWTDRVFELLDGVRFSCGPGEKTELIEET